MKVLLFSQITFKQAWEELYPVILEKGNQNVIVISPAVMVMWPNLFVFLSHYLQNLYSCNLIFFWHKNW